jgi:hypothetical protein
MGFFKIVRVALVALVLAPAYAVAGDKFLIELATPPVWIFGFLGGGVATCTAVNFHDEPITLTTRLIFHDDDDLPFPIRPDTLGGKEVEEILDPGDATALSQNIWAGSSDALLARCVFEYKGDPLLVKAAVILDDQSGTRALTAPAELVRKERLRKGKRDQDSEPDSDSDSA